MSKIFKTLKEALSGSEQEFTTGSINRAILLLSIPMVLEMLMEGLFALVDIYFVSKISDEATATVGMTESVVTIIYSLAIGLSAAATATVARRIGENDHEGAATAAVQAAIIALVLSFLISVFGVIFSEDILRLMGGTDSQIRDCAGYTKLIFGSNFVIMFIFLLNAVFRGAGNASIAMWVLVISNTINIILDPLFIFGLGPFPELGVMGAAVATTTGRGVGVAIQIYLLLRGTNILKIAKRHLVLHLETIKNMLRVASTGALQYIIASASWIFLMRIIAESGTEAVSGYTIAIRIIVFTIMPAWGMANAAATLVGQNLGAGHPERAEASVWRTAHMDMLFMLVVSIVYFIFARQIVSSFDPNPLVVESGVLALRIFSVGYVFFAYGMVISSAFNGAGDTVTPTIINFVCFWLLEIPLGWLFALHFGYGLAGVCWAVFIAESIMAVVLVVLFKRGKWKNVKI
ncbi:MAG: MATE family efflux transporter [Saprospiraceae bacterium]|nr:MATE family efflux transporter [Saprospiraceae bacterium]